MKKRPSMTKYYRTSVRNCLIDGGYDAAATYLCRLYDQYRSWTSSEFNSYLHWFLVLARDQNPEKYFWLYRSIGDSNKLGYLTRRKAMAFCARFGFRSWSANYRRGIMQFDIECADRREWLLQNGQQISLDRFLRGSKRVVAYGEYLISYIKSLYFVRDCFIELSDDFATGYDINFDDSQGGKRWNGMSCMSGRGDEAQEFYGKADCLAIKVKDKETLTQVGRSILWECMDRTGARQLFVDRLYIHPNYAESALAKIDSLFPEAIKYNRDEHPRLTAKAKLSGDDAAMYCDTFGWINSSFSILSTCGGDIELKNTSRYTLYELSRDDEDNRECIHCDNSYHMDDMYYINDDWVCGECRREYYFECQECGDYHHNDDAHEANGKYYCEACFRESFTQCDCCDEIIRIEDTVELSVGSFCQGCIDEFGKFECPDCGEENLNHRYWLRVGDDGVARCPSCNNAFVSKINAFLSDYDHSERVAAMLRGDYASAPNPTIHECVVAEF